MMHMINKLKQLFSANGDDWSNLFGFMIVFVMPIGGSALWIIWHFIKALYTP